jgi:hypothetical protein
MSMVNSGQTLDMPESFDLVAGRWYRFDHYEIHDGIVRPATEAKGEWYDPWTDFRPARSGRSEPPYVGLVGLADPNGAAAGWEDQVTEWCAAHGLLGILHQRSLHAVLAPRVWSSDAEDGITWREYSRSRRFYWGLKCGARWESLVHFWDPMPQPRPYVLTTDIGVSSAYWGYREEPLSRAWGRFFPHVPAAEAEIYQYPNPQSDDFWRSYGEPIDDFMTGARALRSAVEGLAKVARPATTWQEEADREREISVGWQDLNKLLSAVNPVLQFTDGEKPRLEWDAPSLLAHFALMVLLDVAEDRRLYRCAACNRIAVAKSREASYCSDTCRERMQKRRSRARHPP